VDPDHFDSDKDPVVHFASDPDPKLKPTFHFQMNPIITGTDSI
jgi:hypothetical protein